MQKVRLLFVDDEFDIISSFKLSFRKEAQSETFTFHFAQSADEALTLVAQTVTPFDVIVTDLNMPDKTGFDLLAALNEQKTKSLLYVCSTYDQATYIEKAKALGVAGFFKKPIMINTIKKQLQQDLLLRLGVELPFRFIPDPHG